MCVACVIQSVKGVDVSVSHCIRKCIWVKMGIGLKGNRDCITIRFSHRYEMCWWFRIACTLGCKRSNSIKFNRNISIFRAIFGRKLTFTMLLCTRSAGWQQWRKSILSCGRFFFFCLAKFHFPADSTQTCKQTDQTIKQFARFELVAVMAHLYFSVFDSTILLEFKSNSIACSFIKIVNKICSLHCLPPRAGCPYGWIGKWAQF